MVGLVEITLVFFLIGASFWGSFRLCDFICKKIKSEKLRLLLNNPAMPERLRLINALAMMLGMGLSFGILVLMIRMQILD